MYHPLRSLREGHWFKLICGASYQHLPAVRSLTLAYTLAGADCVDVAADPAVVAAARDALQVAHRLAEAAHIRGFGQRRFKHQVEHQERQGFDGSEFDETEFDQPGLDGVDRPWLMVSLNDGEDPHFRKASFDPVLCPTDCSRPCEQICPAEAIVFSPSRSSKPNEFSGVIDSRCYGCGRCVPICPVQQISTRSYVSTAAAVAPLVLSGVDAVEIHTQVGRLHDFKRLWQTIAPFTPSLKLIAISCPDGEGLIDYLWSLYELISPLPCCLLWQTDGRPMSGDIGDGTTRAAVKLGQKVLSAGLPGYVQLAGGTNSHTVAKLQAAGLLRGQNSLSDRYIAGVAYGSYARVLLSPVLEQLQQLEHPPIHPSTPFFPLEAVPDLLWQSVHFADSLVSQLKTPMNLKQTIPRCVNLEC